MVLKIDYYFRFAFKFGLREHTVKQFRLKNDVDLIIDLMFYN